MKGNILNKIVVFLMAVVLWVVIVSGLNYTIIVEVPIEKYNPMSNKVLKNNIPTSAFVRLAGSGTNLIISKYFQRVKLILDISEIDKSGNINLKKYYEKYPNFIYLPKNGIELLDIVYPDSIDIQLDEKVSKLIPIKLISEIKLQPGYIFSKPIVLSEYNVNVTGPKSIIEKLDTIETEKLLLEKVDLSFVKITDYINPNPEFIKFEKKNVTVSGDVEIIGEKEFTDIKIKGVNIPEDFIVRFIPKTVSLVVIGGNNKLQKVSNNEFKVIFDYSKQWIPNKIYYTPIIKIPKDIINCKKIIPNNIEVVFEKK